MLPLTWSQVRHRFNGGSSKANPPLNVLADPVVPGSLRHLPVRGELSFDHQRRMGVFPVRRWSVCSKSVGRFLAYAQ